MPLVEAARTGTMVLIGDRTEIAARFPAALEGFDLAGFGATANLPLRNRSGEVFGALGVAWPGAVDFDDRRVTTLLTISELAAQSIERAWLGDERERDNDRNKGLAHLAESLAVAATRDEVAAHVPATVSAVFAATTSNLGIVLEERGEMRIHHDGHAGPALMAALNTVMMSAPLPHTDSLRDGRAVVVADVDSIRQRYPELAEAMADGGLVSSTTLPVLSSEGHPLAALSVNWDHPTTLDNLTRSALGTITDLVSQTLERVGLAEAEHRLIEDLQSRTLRPVPQPLGLQVAARYLPAAHHVGMGGDWYSAVSLNNGGQLGLVIGDVIGHGIAAAAEMTQLSGILTTLLRVGTALEDLFLAVEEATASTTCMATAVVCLIDIAAGQLRYVSAGHPPLVLCRPDGTTELAENGRHPLIGLPARHVATGLARFDRGSSMVGYTDGLVERRGENLDIGLERLRLAVAETRPLAVTTQVDEVVERCLEGQHPDDDVALVVVRHAGMTPEDRGYSASSEHPTEDEP